MEQTIGLSQFRNAFVTANRADNFSYEGLEILFDHLEDVYYGEYELDVIEICCTYNELSLSDFITEYGVDCEDDKELQDVVEQYLSDRATVVYIDDNIVIFEIF